VSRRLAEIPNEKIVELAGRILAEFPSDPLRAAVEKLDGTRRVTELTRTKIAECLNGYELGGKRDLIDMLLRHWPSIGDPGSSEDNPLDYSLADDIGRHAIRFPDWENSVVLEKVGFLSCSQAKLFEFLEDIVHPIRRDDEEQEQIVSSLDSLLRRDGYCFVRTRFESGHPLYEIQKTAVAGVQPADGLISAVLKSYDEEGVHEAWSKALDRRASDPQGAITAARTLIETVCKHILDEAGEAYNASDNLQALYRKTAQCMQLAPDQHSEEMFRKILGGCHTVVGTIAELRNSLGDSHGQGKRRVRPTSRHAELAVNLAGSMATFLVATWNERQSVT